MNDRARPVAGVSRRGLFLAGAAALAAAAAAAQGWSPSRAIRFVVPFAPGGAADTIARLLADPMAQRLGQPLTIDNRPGGATAIGAVAVTRADPDGHTLFYATPNVQILNPFLMRSLRYDPQADFAPVIALMRAPKLLVVRPEWPATDVASLLDLARRATAPLTYASAGFASSGHLAAVMMGQMAGVELLHVPFRGTAPARQEVMAGRIDFMIDNIATLLPLVRDGRLRALAVSTSDPAAAAPELPPLARTLPGYHDASFSDVLAPARTPPEVIARLNAAFNAALDTAPVVEAFTNLGIEKLRGTPAELAALVREEQEGWGPVIQRGGISLQ